MRRNVKTILMGTVALMAGVGLASAQGMRDAPGSAGDRGASSSQMTPDSSGSHREMKGAAERGKNTKNTKSETRGQVQGERQMNRGQAQRGPSDKDMSKGQAKSERPERSTIGQGASEGPKSKRSAKPPEKSTTGQATKDKADTGKSAAGQKDEKSTTGQAPKYNTEKSTTGQASKDKAEKSTTGQGSSDSKPQTQPMNRQSQDPNAAKQNQTSGSATQSSSTESNASIRSQAGVQVSSQQRTTIQRSVLEARNVPRVDRVSFSIHTGTVVPRNVRIVAVTTFPALIEVFPGYRGYSFFVVEDEIVFVDRSHRIVDVVSFGGGGRVGRAPTSTTVAVVDLTEPEIREVQTVLIREGFLRGRVTGVFDTRTRTALISFQRKRGFEATGRIDTRTVTALGLEGKVKVKSESSSSSSSSQSSSSTGQSSSGAQKSDPKATTGQGMNGAQKPDQKSTTGQGQPSPAQKNATPEKGPSEPKGSDHTQPTPKDQRSSAPNTSTTGQGGSDKPDGQNEKRRQ